MFENYFGISHHLKGTSLTMNERTFGYVQTNVG